MRSTTLLRFFLVAIMSAVLLACGCEVVVDNMTDQELEALVIRKAKNHFAEKGLVVGSEEWLAAGFLPELAVITIDRSDSGLRAVVRNFDGPGGDKILKTNKCGELMSVDPTE